MYWNECLKLYKYINWNHSSIVSKRKIQTKNTRKLKKDFYFSDCQKDYYLFLNKSERKTIETFFILTFKSIQINFFFKFEAKPSSFACSKSK